MELEERCKSATKDTRTQSLFYCERIEPCPHQIEYTIGEYAIYCRKESWRKTNEI